MSKKHIFLFVFAAPVLAISLALANAYYGVFQRSYNGPEIIFSVKSGQTFGVINTNLKNKEIINSSRLFHRYTKFTNKMESFKVGNYKILPGMTMVDVLEKLTSGKAITTTVTIPEGKNLFEVATILEKNKIITSAKDFIRLAKTPEVVKSFNIKAKRLEGYLYPDTYHFNKNSNPKTIMNTMIRTFNKKVSSLNFDNTKLSRHEVIILASIVEKETGAKFERPTIAGVFHNRLRKRMRLQSDPTTIYGIYENYNGNLRKKHLLEKTPYNTYKIPALPVGPISNPGLESIRAVLNPEKHDYLYFVSKNDGTHIFSKTYKQHRQAVNTWQRNKANRKGRSWRNLKQ